MHLKRLELFGFKSFADRTVLEFNRGLTAIVGPNGSGKSNIADAVRWVLGEQSARSLRGSKMEDIIFSGSESRHPINYAEVSITLDNEDQRLNIDFSEVVITRRVFRSGESQFFINNEPCRLKDVVELFMDTGLGRDAYSIISQGKIDEILNSRPEERRAVFEEVAGIVRYKSHKQDAEKKLSETAANLERIKDIIVEVERQLGPLEVESKKAVQFQEWQEELSKIDIACYVHSIESVYQRWQNGQAELTELKQEAEGKSVHINQLESRFQDIRWQLIQLEKKLEAHQDQLLSVTAEGERLEAKRDVLKERHKNNMSRLNELGDQLAALDHQIEEANQELAEAKQRLAERQSETTELRRKVDLKENEMSVSLEESVDQLEQLKGDYIEQLNRQAALKNEARHLSERHNHEEQRLNRLRTEYDTVKHNLHVREEQMEVLNSRLEAIQQELDHVHKQRQHAVKVKEGLLKEQQHAEEAYRKGQLRIEQLEERRRVLRELKAEYSGFRQGTKAVLKARGKQLNGIEGAVAELISVASQHELAIEIALGAALQYIVVQHEQAAREAIAYLKRGHFGRATFLPLNVLKARMIPAEQLKTIKHADGVVDVAHQLVKVDDKYRVVIQHLLGQVIVMQDLKQANHLAKALQYRYRLVTLDGDVVHAGGMMTGGGTQRQQSNLLSRDSELAQLNEQLVIRQKESAQTKERLKRLEDALIETDRELDILEMKHLELQDRQQKENETYLQLRFEVEHLHEKMAHSELEIEDLLTKINEMKQKESALQTEINQVEEQTVKMRETIARREAEKKEWESSRIEANEELTQLKVLLASRQEEQNSIKQYIERLHIDQEQRQHERQRCIEERTRLQEHNALARQELMELEEEIQAKVALRQQLLEERLNMREERTQIQNASEQLQQEINAQRRILKEFEEKINEVEVKCGRLDVELENYLTLLREEYQLSFELAKERYPLEIPYEEAQQKVKQLKNKISGLGTVNVGAIEQFQRLDERYQFLKQQEEDLQQAKSTLIEVIEEMDQTMSKQFKETFEAVRSHFSHVFEQMFGGGKADLKLTDPTDLLTTGVEIVAQPPGKKLQNLALLSGGERALTAIVLLFSILEVKPVPFCVLDEAEAALDEANVHRFADYLSRKSSRTQFIVITHRRGTMEAADVLYGVTMPEGGISKLVSVKLLAS